MLPWNVFKHYSQRLRPAVSALADVNTAAAPRILKLWLLCSVLWLLLLCLGVAFLYWYYDQQWLLQHRLMLVVIAVAGWGMCIIMPVCWRLFAVLDGQESRVARMTRTSYQRITPIQQRLDALAAHLQQKYPFHWLNRQYILAVQGEPEAFSDVGEQLQRVGWAEVDQVYLVLMNELDDVSSVPLWRGKYQSPFDGVVLLRDLDSGTSAACGEDAQAWLDKFYQLINWKIPFAHIFQSDQLLEEVPENLSWCLNGKQSTDTLKQHIYSAIMQHVWRVSQFQRPPLFSFLEKLDEVSMAPAAHYSEEQLAYCQVIGVQASQSHWWRQWQNLSIELHRHAARRIRIPKQITYARIGIGILLLVLVWMGISFGRNLQEIKLFRQQIDAVRSIKSSQAAIAPLLALQNHIVLRQNAPLSSFTQMGFNHDRALLTKALPAYGEATKQWLVVPADQQIAKVLQSLPAYQWQPPSVLEQDLTATQPAAEQSSNALALDEGFDALKAYLMLRYPKRVDNIYLTDYLSRLYLNQTAAQQNQIHKLFEFYTQLLPKQKSWFLPLDSTLVIQSRAVLNYLYLQQQQDEQLYQSLLAAAQQRFMPLKLTDLAGKESQTFWKSKEILSGAFTAKAWREWFEPELKKLNPAHYKNGSWVLNDQGGDEDNDIRKQIMARYQQDYFQHWLKFLSGIEWIPSNNLNIQVERLKQYADKNNSVLVKLLSAIQENTRIGYAENRTNQGKGVLTEFEPIVALIQATQTQSGQKRALDQYQENLLAMYLQLQKIQGASNQAAASQLAFNAILSDPAHANADFVKVQQAIDLQVANLGVQWQGIGHTLLGFPFEDSKKIALQPALLNINQLWQQMVFSPWQQRFAQKYPLNKQGQQDVSLAELQAFIDPQKGVIAQFNRQYLNDVLMLVGNQWQINPALSDEVSVDPAFINQLNALNQLLEFVAAGNGAGSFELRITPMAEIKQIKVIAAGQQWNYLNEKPYWHKLNWPIDANTDKKSSIEWVDINDQHGQLEVMGDLSILHLLDKATTATVNSDGSYHLQWQIQGKKINMDIKSMQTNDFITLLKLKGFDFPAAVFKVGQHAD